MQEIERQAQKLVSFGVFGRKLARKLAEVVGERQPFYILAQAEKRIDGLCGVGYVALAPAVERQAGVSHGRDGGARGSALDPLCAVCIG